MSILYGKKVMRKELLKRVGDISQIAGVRIYELTEGNEKGVEAVDIKTGTGFRFTVLPGRGLDISFAEYKGIPLSWISSCGEVAAPYYEPEGLGYLRSVHGGLLFTCGLTQVGMPCEDMGEKLGLHGRVSNIPAKNVHADSAWVADEYAMWVRGKVIETRVFGENVVLHREISAKMGESCLYVHDVIENRGFSKIPHMLLYHINGGYPAVDDGSLLLSPTKKAEPRDDEAKIKMEEYNKFYGPTHGFKERVYYHDMGCDKEGNVLTALVNKKFNGGEGFGFYVKYFKKELPCFIEWKMCGEREYVVGMEPANCRVAGRSEARKRGELEFLEPGEKREYHLEIGVLPGKREILELEKKIKVMQWKRE